MFRTLLTTTAMVVILQAGAYAQDTTAPDPATPTMNEDAGASQTMDENSADAGAASEEDPATDTAATDTASASGAIDGYYSATEGQILANKLIGKTVYNNQTEEAESIGSVNDVVISAEGEAEAVIIGVGGFLGIGEKNVAVQFDRVTWVGEQGDERIVVETTKEQLEAAPAFDTVAMAPVDETQDAAGGVAMAPTSDMPAAPDGGDTTAMAPADPAAPAAGEETAEAPADPAAEEETAMTDDSAADPAAEQETAMTEDNATDPAAEQETAMTDDSAADPAAEQETAMTEDSAADPAAEQETAMTEDSAADPAAEQETAMTDDSAAGTDTETTTGAISSDATTDSAADQMTGNLDDRNFETVDVAEVSAEDLTGATVYNANQESIGEVSDVILTDDGSIEAFIVDVGGFLGIGEKSVAIGSQELDFKRDEGGNLAVFTPFTEQELEQQAAYDPEAYEADRESGALMAPRT